MIYFLWCATIIICGTVSNFSFESDSSGVTPIVLYFLVAFFKSGAAVPGSMWLTYGFMAKLTISWFFIVWLRLNLMRLRFDQVASYTWHELLLYCIFLLVELVIAIWLF